MQIGVLYRPGLFLLNISKNKNVYISQISSPFEKISETFKSIRNFSKIYQLHYFTKKILNLFKLCKLKSPLYLKF